MYTQQYHKEGRNFEQPNAFFRVKNKILVLNDNKILMLEEIAIKRYELPGGGWDHFETFHDAILREVDEELGVELDSCDDFPKIIEQGLHPNGYSAVVMYFFAKLKSFDFKLEPGYKAHWIDKETFKTINILGDEKPILDYADQIFA